MTGSTEPHIAFVGESPTVGDTAIGQSILQGLRRYVGLPIQIYTKRKNVISKLPGFRPIDRVFASSLPRISIEEGKYVELSRYHYHLINDLRESGGRFCLSNDLYEELKRLFENCAGLVFQGGPQWNSKWINYKKTTQRRYLLEVARFYSVPTFHVGVSCGPFDWRMPEKLWLKPLFRKTLSLYSKIYVRDSFSTPSLKSIGVSKNVVNSTDAAVFLDTLKDDRFGHVEGIIAESSGRPKVVVCLRDFQTNYPNVLAHRDRVITEIVYLLDRISEEYADVFFLGTDHTQIEGKSTDAEVAKNVISRMTSKKGTLIEVDVWNPSALKHVYGQFDAMVTMRLHPSILALGCGVPSLVLAYDPKCEDFLKSLGLERFAVPIEQFSLEASMPLVEELINNKDLQNTIKFKFDGLRRTHASDYQVMYEMIRERANRLKFDHANSAIKTKITSSSRITASSRQFTAMLAIGLIRTVAKTAGFQSSRLSRSMLNLRRKAVERGVPS